MELTPHAAGNRRAWGRHAARYVEAGQRNWESNAPSWGIWSIPDAQLPMLGDPCDPELWIAEASRVLRPGGELVFLTNAPLLMMCTAVDAAEDEPATTQLLRPQFGMRAVQFPDDPDATEFHIPHGEMIDLLSRNHFTVEALIEVQAPADATTTYEFVTREWAQSWPSEEVWRARKHAS